MITYVGFSLKSLMLQLLISIEDQAQCSLSSIDTWN